MQRIAGNGTGDTRWKVPGVLDWSTGIYNPRVDITKDTTTLYASDRDVFLLLVDDMNPIEAGRLPDGSPDLYFRGFYCWNSEVGTKTLGMTLEELMAFTVSEDHERQNQVRDAIKGAWSKESYQIRRMLTETTVRASDMLHTEPGPAPRSVVAPVPPCQATACISALPIKTSRY